MGHSLSHVGLNAKGRDQAERAAKRLELTQIDRVISSDSERAVETARIIVNDLTPIEKWETLRERFFGSLEGASTATFREKAAESGLECFKSSWLFNPEGGENIKELDQRAGKAAEKLLQEAECGRTMLVSSHGGFLKHFMAYLAENKKFSFNETCSNKEYWRLQANTAITILDYDKFNGEIVCQSLYEDEHLNDCQDNKKDTK